MSDHALPPDMAAWPRDPYQLLGVSWGVSARDLRRAYLHLIRTYKPEHAPEQFRRIREAYEMLRAFAPSLPEGPPTADSNESVPALPPGLVLVEDRSLPPSASGDEAIQTVPSPGSVSRDPWDLACEGDVETAYRILSDRLELGWHHEETCLQLYWLLMTHPSLDPRRKPIDMIVRGLASQGESAHLLRELLGREAEADPNLVISDRLAPLLAPGVPLDLLPEIVAIRWRSAQQLRRWDVVHDDVEALRPRISIADEDSWTRLLIAAASNLVWAEKKGDRARSMAIGKELKSLGRNSLDLADPLFRLDYAYELDKGLTRFSVGCNPISRLLRLPVDIWQERTNLAPVFRRLFGFPLGERKAFISQLRQLIALSWDGCDPEVIDRLRSHLARVAKHPWGSVRTLDFVANTSPVAFTRLTTVLDESGLALPFNPAQPSDPLVAAAVEQFLAGHRWWKYPKFRRQLLDFCVREMIHPTVFVWGLSGRVEYAISPKVHLAQIIEADQPLLYVYRAVQSFISGSSPL